MIENRIKRIWREKGLAIGMFSGGIASTSIVEVIGYSGFDAVYFDMEHTSFSMPEIQVMILAAEKHEITPVVRIPALNPALIGRLLDIGALGIYVTHVSDAESARVAVRATRYAPLGDRGVMMSCRAAEFGNVPLQVHMEESNREVLLAVMIEDRAGVDNIEEIAAVEGLDLIAIGPADLATALGVGNEANHPVLVQAIEHVAAVVAKRPNLGLAIPKTGVFTRSAQELKDLGVVYMNVAPVPENRLRRILTDEVSKIRAGLIA
jgi:2-keto-3-deoxy-L-rhamnonate aldolase RhmA